MLNSYEVDIPETEAMVIVESRIQVGGVYIFHQPVSTVGGGMEVDVGSYRVEDFPYDPITCREVVYYRGLDGKDKGRAFVCSFDDFATKFRPTKNPGG